MLTRRKQRRADYGSPFQNERVGGRHRQSVVATLGRIADLERSGMLERLLRSGARCCEQAA